MTTRDGEVLDGRYTLVRLLGAGGMGEVYEARHTKLGRKYAIKFLLPDFASNREILQRFFNEAEAAGRLTHGNIAAALDVGVAPDGAPYIVLEYLDGTDAQRLLEREGPLPVERAVDLVVQASRGLDAAHADGIIHRDLKPANLFVTTGPDGTDVVKVLDFGIAKLANAASSGGGGTKTGVVLGTVAYMSPEQVAEGAAGLDARSDVYSLGVVLYQLVSGHAPHEGDTVATTLYKVVHAPHAPLDVVRPGVPAALARVVDRALAKRREDRFASMHELAAALAPWLPRHRRAGASDAPRAAAPAPVVARVGGAAAATAVGLVTDDDPPEIPRSRAPVALGVGVAAVALGLAGIVALRASTVSVALRASTGAVDAPPPLASAAAASTAVVSAPASSVALGAPPAASSPATPDAPAAPSSQPAASASAPARKVSTAPVVPFSPPKAKPPAAPPPVVKPTFDSLTDDRK